MSDKIRIDYNPFTPFNIFKWAIYFLLMVNVYVFFQEDKSASAILFPGGMALGDIIVGFAASIDTAAWVLLILLFELETYILPDELLVGRTKNIIHSLRILFYVVIIYSFYGYLGAYLALFEFSEVEPVVLCSLVDGVNTFMTTQDEYELLTMENCASISQSSTLYAHGNEAIYANAETFAEASGLGLIDVINSGVWLLICFVLELDVRLELKGLLEGRKLFVSNLTKLVLYAILLVCAVYWGINGEFVDFWDAFLWILAFAAIEMNMFQWHQEEKPSAT
ncbi:MAG: hypothetical protein AAF431_15795 [Pseudomonadota bacterium]